MTALSAALVIQRASIAAARQLPRTARVMAVLPSQPLPGPLVPRQLFQPVTAQAARLRKHGETQ